MAADTPSVFCIFLKLARAPDRTPSTSESATKNRDIRMTGYPIMAGWLLGFNSYGHITARANLVTYSVFDDRIYEIIGETCHRDHYPTLFRKMTRGLLCAVSHRQGTTHHGL